METSGDYISIAVFLILVLDHLHAYIHANRRCLILVIKSDFLLFTLNKLLLLSKNSAFKTSFLVFIF